MLLEKMQTNQGGELINSKQVVVRMSQKIAIFLLSLTFGNTSGKTHT